MRDWEKTVISQFASSKILLALLTSLNDCLDPRASLEQFYNLIWNIDTATGYGLDVWGRIVGVNRVLTVAASSYFGFGEAGDRTGFNQSPFYNGQPTTYNYTLADEAYRLLIFAKAAANITDNSIPAVNAILRSLFPGRGNCYVAEGNQPPSVQVFGFGEAGDRTPFNQAPFADSQSVPAGGMSLVYVVKFPLYPFELAILQNSGVLPKGVGVLAIVSYPGLRS